MSNPNTAIAKPAALTHEEIAALVPTSLDALLTPTHEDSGESEGRKAHVPYVGFRGKKSTKNTEALDAAGIKVGKDGSGVFYLMDSGEPLKIEPFGLHVIQFARFYTNTDDDGRVVDARLKNTDALFNAGFREHLYAAVAVALGGGKFVAATLQLQSGQCNALRQTIQLLGDNGLPGPACDPKKWATRGAAHAASAVAKVPGARFRTDIWSVLTPPKSGKGQPYNEGHGRTYPTPEAEALAFNEWTKTDWPFIQAAITKYNMMVETTKRLALNAPVDAEAKAADPIPF